MPQPISRPRPPIMIAGGGEKKTLRLVARYADQCNIVGSPPEIAAKLDILRGHCETEGNPVEFTRRIGVEVVPVLSGL